MREQLPERATGDAEAYLGVDAVEQSVQRLLCVAEGALDVRILGIFQVVVAFWASRYPERSQAILVLWIGIGAVARRLMFIIIGFGLRSARRHLA